MINLHEMTEINAEGKAFIHYVITTYVDGFPAPMMNFRKATGYFGKANIFYVLKFPVRHYTAEFVLIGLDDEITAMAIRIKIGTDIENKGLIQLQMRPINHDGVSELIDQMSYEFLEPNRNLH